MIKKMDRKYVRRRRVVGFIAGAVMLVAAYYVVNHIWWTGTSYCWGSSQKCIGL